jgi:hypothetical protein
VDKDGHPISIVDLFKYPTESSDTYPALERLRNKFALSKILVVSDIDFIKDDVIRILKKTPGVDYIAKLLPPSPTDLADDGHFKPRLLDDRDTYDFTAPLGYSGYRCVAYKNHDLFKKRTKAREALIETTCKKFDKIIKKVEKGKLKDASEIGLAVGRIIGENKIKKYFDLTIKENFFEYVINDGIIELGKGVDAISIFRTHLNAKTLSSEECVKLYKYLCKLEKTISSIETEDLGFGPNINHPDDRFDALLFLSMLSSYTASHMKIAWSDLTLTDTFLSETKNQKAPATPHKTSEKVERKGGFKETIIAPKTMPDKSFKRLLANLGNVCDVNLVLRKTDAEKKDIAFSRTQKLTLLEQKALDLILEIPKYPSAL